MTDLILVEQRADGIAILTLNRPEARNALSRSLVEQFSTVVNELSDSDSLRAVVITGAGDKAFCAGADLIERTTMSSAERTAHTGAILVLFELIAAVPVPVIAALHGFALAGGAEMALACDIRIASTDVQFGLPEVRIGIFPGAGGLARLPRLVGPAVAADLLYTGRRVNAEEALRVGLVNQIVGPGEVLRVALDLATQIAESAPLGVRAIKAALRESDALPIPDANRVIATYRRPLDDTDDYAEGLAAFAEKRKPIFTGN